MCELPPNVVTTRFNTETLSQNIAYRKTYNVQCIYCEQVPMPMYILLNNFVFVIEMNNSTNEIAGIGMVRNTPADVSIKEMYGNPSSVYMYKGILHLNRETMLRMNAHFVDIMDKILFTGKTHSKRGCGFTSIPVKLASQVGFKIPETIKKMFVDVYSSNREKSNQTNQAMHTHDVDHKDHEIQLNPEKRERL
jgi:hypothetical protein